MPRLLPLAIALLALPAAAPAQSGDPAGAPAQPSDPAGAPAQPPDPAGAPARPTDPAAVPLDRLLKLPPARPSEASPENADRERWRERFAAQHRDLRLARESLADSQRQLEELAESSDAWQITAPGANPSPENSPLSYKLRQDIRAQREEVDRAERALRDLEVEASLAGVPAEWRRLPQADAAADGQDGE